MINNDMDSKLNTQEELLTPPQKPNESSGIYVRGFVKITDPESGEVMVETGN
jgi:hypothetical protein